MIVRPAIRLVVLAVIILLMTTGAGPGKAAWTRVAVLLGAAEAEAAAFSG